MEEVKEEVADPEKKKLMRDETDLKDYYEAWDKIDVVCLNFPFAIFKEPLLREIEEDTPQTQDTKEQAKELAKAKTLIDNKS